LTTAIVPDLNRDCYPLFASFVTISDALKAIDNNGFSVFSRSLGSASAVILAKFGNELTKLPEAALP